LSDEGKVKRIWVASTGRELGTFLGSEFEFSPGAASLIAHERDSTRQIIRTRIWRLDDSPTRFFHHPLHKVSHFDASRDAKKAVIATVTPTLEAPRMTPEIRDSRTGQMIRELAGHHGNLSDLGFSRDGRYVVTLSKDSVRVWETETGRAIAIAGARPDSTLGTKALFLKSGQDDLLLWDIDKAVSTAVLKGAAKNLHSATFSPDERFGLIHSGDVARLLDVASGRELARWEAVSAVSFNNERVIVVFKDGSATLIDIAAARTIARVDAGRGKVDSAELSGRFVLLTFENGTVRLLDGTTGARRAEFRMARPLAKTDKKEISVDGRRIVLWSAQSAQLELRDGETGAQIAVVPCDPAVAISRFLIADGRRLITVDQGKAALFDSETGKVIRQLEGGTDQPTTAVRVSEASGRILTISNDGEVRTWDARTGASVARLPGSGHASMGALFSPDGRRVAMKASDETVRLWDPETGDVITTIKSKPHDNAFVRFSRDGDRFLFVRLFGFPSGAGTVQLIDPSGQPLAAIEHSKPVKTLDVSPDGNRVLTVTRDSVVQLWNAADGQRIIRHEGHLAQVWSAFTKDGRRVAVVSAPSGAIREWKVQILDSDSGRILGSSTGKLTDAVDARGVLIWFSPDGRHLMMLLRDASGSLFVFDGENGSLITQNDSVPMSKVDTGRVGANGKWLLIKPASNDRTVVRLWDSVAAKEIGTFSASGTIMSEALSLDGRYLAVGSVDKLVRLWELPSGSPIGSLSGHTDTVYGLAFSKDGQLLLSGSNDGTVRAWRVPSGELARTLESGSGTRDAIREVAFLSESRRVAASTARGIRIWDFQTGEPLALVDMWGKPEAGIDDRYVVSQYPDEAVVRRIFRSTQELVEAVQAEAPRCLTPTERKAHFLDPEPPRWCIEMGKWPYHNAAWKQWFADRKAGRPAEMPAE